MRLFDRCLRPTSVLPNGGFQYSVTIRFCTRELHGSTNNFATSAATIGSSFKRSQIHQLKPLTHPTYYATQSLSHRRDAKSLIRHVLYSKQFGYWTPCPATVPQRRFCFHYMPRDMF